MIRDGRFPRLLVIAPLLALTVFVLSIFNPFYVTSRPALSAYAPHPNTNAQQSSDSDLQPNLSTPSAIRYSTSTTLPTTLLSSATTFPDIESTAVPSVWSFDPSRDARNYGLGEEQCHIAFEPLFAELDRAKQHRKSLGNITQDDIDMSWVKEGAIRAMIYDRQIHILESKLTDSDHHRIRALAILNAINRAITATQEAIPNIEFSFSISDDADPGQEHRTIWALSHRTDEEEKWVMSDFGYWSWPLDMLGEYSQVRSNIREKEPGWESKIPKLVWRGAAGTNKLRKTMLKVVKGKAWADVREVLWKSATVLKKESEGAALSMAQHCGYQFVLQTEGRSYSGRGKYLQNCHSVFIAHEREWVEPQHTLLVASGPDQNFVEVKRDFSDLETKIEALIQNPDSAKRIADNSVKVFRDRYLTPAAQACYWRRLIRNWASVSFEPKKWETIAGTDGKQIRKTRGVPYESFM
ncbi:hypothetical protein EJ08DRAFT_583334 [Tothia fuscella]|uniref:Glycosyl transferase CAP10 domain-containing protein n=1 Tax=Tothia fuscella TaxID=1048955 RepID=A0A9P4U1F5_9PEZI|nr:hypothetical protein EJ08DRAFT_583334 [Tothia fuscella]